jgi:uncharacterized membrane protein YphA (DoxX/SURF4 family)
LLGWARHTTTSNAPRTKTLGAATARLVAGVTFLGSSVLKEASPRAHANWAAMVHELGLPMGDLAIQVAPVLELLVALLLLVGLLARLAALAGLCLMAGAAWIHLTVNPSALPVGLPPNWLPVITALACAVVLWQGAGPFSLDRRQAQTVTAEATPR